MIRTQISLDANDYELVRQESQSMGISVAEFVRRAIRDALPATGQGRWMRFAGMIDSGDSRSSQSIDEIVYGAKD